MELGKVISSKRKACGLTQQKLADMLHISFQAVSKWENNTAYPDLELLPKLAAALNTSLDALFSYSAVSVTTDYERRYSSSEDYYWGLNPNRLCFEIMKQMPPIKPLKVLDIGCGEGKDAVFLAKNGYIVTAFDAAQSGIDKAASLAEKSRVSVDLFKADIRDYRPDTQYDIIFSSGVLHYAGESMREEFMNSLKEHTADGGLNVLNVFVGKPFIPEKAPDADIGGTPHLWKSGELFTYYHDWLFTLCREEVFDCCSGGIPHKHCMDTLIAKKTAEL